MALTKVTGQGIDSVTVDSSGNVGIGTTTPNKELSVVGNVELYNDEVDGYIWFHDYGTASYAIGRDQSSDTFSINRYSDLTTNPLVTVTSGGNVLVGKTARGYNSDGIDLRNGTDGNDSHFTVNNGTVCSFNRRTSDGSIINIGQDGTVEGQITVSGTTVTYGGGHLGRWSRLLDNSKDATILKGTVMTNLDEMVEWGDEDNEQLNKMAVSSVEGDVNVSGVFVSWDNDDDYNDMMVAMTGDMVIRIAQGTTVQRGVLLMSAGDGTAKPQGDDIVRSKTIAKVTSTHVSHTYDDGSYLVPCVLMAC